MSVITTAIPTGTWTVDPAHSSIEFQVRHMGIATVRGAFTRFRGTFRAEEDGSATAEGSVETASVDTREDRRDQHLRSPDFFDADRHPQITFRSTEVEPGDDGFEIHGELSMHGVTGPITLHAEIQGTEEDPWGNERVGLEVTGELRRSDWGITFNQALGSGNVMVSDRVRLFLDISAIKEQ